MRASLLYYTADSRGRKVSPHAKGSAPNPVSANRAVRELVWILISLLLLLFLATSYIFWAKIESAWPIFRGM